MRVTTTISIEPELLAWVRKNRINLSGYVNDSLRNTSGIMKQNIEQYKDLELLKEEISNLSGQMSVLLQQKKRLEVKIREEKEKEPKLKEWREFE